ncbi:unnamed protein product, partial [Urochloa humidicola]
HCSWEKKKSASGKLSSRAVAESLARTARGLLACVKPHLDAVEKRRVELPSRLRQGRQGAGRD